MTSLDPRWRVSYPVDRQQDAVACFDGPRRPYRRILVSLPRASAASTALGVAARLARSTGAELVLAGRPLRNAVHPPWALWAGPGDPAWSACLDDLQRCAEQLEPGLRVRTLVLDGSDWVDDLVQTARGVGADLLVMNTRGRSGAARLLSGSVAEHVARLAPCPTMLVGPGCGAFEYQTGGEPVSM